MRKRIILSSLVTVLFALIVLTCSFIALVNMDEIQKTKETLALYNDFFSKEENINEIDYSKYKLNGKAVRFTTVDKDGKVLFDTRGELSENHKNREEIVQAFEDGVGTSVRFSSTAGANLVYYATKVNDNMVVRSSVPVSTVQIFTSGWLKYYIVVLIIVALLSLALSTKLVRIIVYPVKELERVTNKIANGELNKRAIIYNYDEIGSLAQTFNEMADQLQIQIYDAFDKQNKLEAILESMDSGVIAVDNKHSIMLINPYAKKIFGLTGDIIGQKLSECIIDYDLINFVREIPDIDSKEIKLFHPNEREIRVKKAPIISGSKVPIGIVIAISDITDIKRLENMRSQFVANVSHELKTPLTSIKGFSETLKYVDDENTRNKFLDIINKEAERLSRLINDILVLSNIENMHKMKKEHFDPNDVINEAIDIVMDHAVKKSVEITFDMEYRGELVGDRDKFYQLALNLIENGVKYSKDNGKVYINTKDTNNNFIFEVIDNGIGIPKDDLPRIFERFYRVDKSRTTKGTGLGLAIVKHIVKLFDGEIDVQSRFGEGSQFVVKIKCKK